MSFLPRVLWICFLYAAQQTVSGQSLTDFDTGQPLTEINADRSAYTRASAIFYNAAGSNYKDGRAMHGAFCGTVNVTIPWVNVHLYSGRIAILFDLDKPHFDFRINGDKHVPLCRSNSLVLTKENGVVVSATPEKGWQRGNLLKCLADEYHDGETLTFRVKDTNTVHAQLTGVGILARGGGTLEADLTREACEIDYKGDGGHIPYQREKRYGREYSNMEKFASPEELKRRHGSDYLRIGGIGKIADHTEL